MNVQLKNKREAAEFWVREFNAIDEGMISALICQNPDDWYEVTLPRVGDRVYVAWLVGDSTTHEGEISSVGDGVYIVELDDGCEASLTQDEFEVIRDYELPIWGTMWSFGDKLDDWWLEEKDGLRAMSDCGLRVYKSEEFGYFFGIDGAGYDFFESHWIPLYEARGLHWHDEETEAA